LSGQATIPDRALAFLLPLLAFALPLSIAASEITLGLAIVFWLVSRPWQRAQVPGLRAVLWCTVALAASWLLASATSPEPVASLIKARKLYSIVLVLVLADLGRSESMTQHIVTAALAGGLVSAAIGFAQFAQDHLAGRTQDPLEGVFSTAMTSGNVLATLVLVATACVLWPRRGARLVLFDRAALAALFVALVMTFRRSAYLGWIAGSATLIGLRRGRWLFVLPVVAALALLFGPSYVRERAYLIVHPVDYNATGRVSLWQSGLAAFRDRPVTGWGLQDALGLIAHYRRGDATFVAGHFHNNWVQIAVTTGVVGLACYAAWMGLVGYLLWRAYRRMRGGVAAAGLAVFVGFQVGGLFDWSFGDAEVANQFFLWVGLALAASAASLPAAGERGAR
jgi:O-antigen ligase